jgi:hypothetical protein
MKCSSQVHVVKIGFPAGDNILGDGGDFRRWSLTGRSISLNHLFILLQQQQQKNLTSTGSYKFF